MATIEPRLIHLLNDPTTPEAPNTEAISTESITAEGITAEGINPEGINPEVLDAEAPNTEVPSQPSLPSLPALQLLPLSGNRDGPLPPLQLEGLRADRFFGSAGRNAALPGPSSGAPGAPLASPYTGDQTTAFGDFRREADYSREGKYAGSAALYPLKLLLSEVTMPPMPTPPAPSFTSILNEGPDFQDDAPPSSFSCSSTSTSTISTTASACSSALPYFTAAATCSSSSFASSSSTAAATSSVTAASTSNSNNKRPAIHIKDDFMQLPQPTKKPKAHQAPLMPPIINGLLEPPPHVTIFPPIESSAFDDTDAGQSKLLHELSYSPPGPRLSPEPDQPVTKPRTTRKRSSKPRRKWSEEETNHLLRGVDRHGVGKWTSILDDPDFHFNSRSAGDLKDRFRTCCPEEMRVTDVDEGQFSARRRQLRNPFRQLTSPQKTPENMAPETSPAEGGTLSGKDSAAGASCETDEPPIKKSRAHRMKVSDLAGLGITGPFRRARRRERTAFSNRDDQEILQGLETYGPSWSKIQRDKRFHLGTRQPTDLRDRVRNKYPYIYQRIEKGVFQPKDVSVTNILEPIVNTNIVHSFKPRTAAAAPSLTLTANSSASRGAAQEEPPKWLFQTAGSAEQQQQPQQQQQAPRDSDEPPPSAPGGEMGIARLLLDDGRSTPSIT
ncbi:Telobox protein 1 [Trichoderma ghanense]|uniref:Telobox protein 1 n=1 Tax=Trichoderma ghanense TaxID=65468 RepID=A0ABY2H6M6_9HYPO